MRRFFSTLLSLIALGFFLTVPLEYFWLHLTSPLENRVSDFFVRIQARALQPDPDIVIVDIDEHSITSMAEVAGSWPWPRSVHGELVAGISKQQPKAIVFDILFGEPDIFRREADAYFNEALRGLNNVYLPIVRHEYGPAGDAQGTPLAEVAAALGMTPGGGDPKAKAALLLPQAVDRANWRLGVINFLEDDDGIGRRYYVHMPAYGWKIPSLPARVALDLGHPLPEAQSIRLGWRGREISHRRISYVDLYSDFSRQKRERNPAEFKNKIVIIGATATGLHDIRATPISSLYPAVQILATAIDNLKNRGYMQAAPPYWPALVTLLLLAALFLAFLRHWHTLKIGVTLLPVTIVLLGASFVAAGRQYSLPLLSPVIFSWAFYFACALQEYLQERKEREKAVQMFSRFVNPHVVKELIAHGGLSRAGEARQVSVLFSDIRGFTTLSETRTPQEVVSLLNRYFSLQVGVIFRHGGSLDKFIGDAIMAFWGAPLDDPRHAENAILAALDMTDCLETFKRELGEFSNSFDVGIGIHSGPAVVGLIGSEQRREYTAIGDTVNLSSRIEGLTKGVARILVSEDTRLLCQDAFDFVGHGSYKVKGRAQEVKLFEPKRKSS